MGFGKQVEPKTKIYSLKTKGVTMEPRTKDVPDFIKVKDANGKKCWSETEPKS